MVGSFHPSGQRSRKLFSFSFNNLIPPRSSCLLQGTNSRECDMKDLFLLTVNKRGWVWPGLILSVWILSAGIAGCGPTGSEERVHFNVPAGLAVETLKEAAGQAKAEFIFSSDLVKGVRTPSVQGEFTPLEAFSLMLAETSLDVFQHEQSGVYAITKVSDIQIPELEPKPIEQTEMKTKSNNWFKTLAAVLTIGIAIEPLPGTEGQGLVRPIIDQPIRGDALTTGDLWASYNTTILDGKVDWKIQLNVRNAIADRGYQAIKANPDGSIAVVRNPPPIDVFLTNTFKF